MRSGSLMNSGCDRGLCCRSAEPSGERVQDARSHWNVCSMLRASHRHRGRGRGSSSYSMGASAQPDTVTLCGSWVLGVTGGDWDRSPGL